MDTSALNPSGTTADIIMPLPDYDFDPTEAAIPWKVLTERGWKVAFSTEHGNIAQGEPLRLKGPLPGLLSASLQARAAYSELSGDAAFRHPIPYSGIDPDRYQAILLPGGDTSRMRQYLENNMLQSKVLQFWQRGKLLGAICHGPLVLARTIDPSTGCSVLYGHRVTALPRWLDRTAYRLARLLGRDYLMYPRCVEEEVRASLERPEDFSRGPSILAPYAVSDGNLVTARWYGDAELFSKRFAQALEQRMPAATGAIETEIP